MVGIECVVIRQFDGDDGPLEVGETVVIKDLHRAQQLERFRYVTPLALAGTKKSAREGASLVDLPYRDLKSALDLLEDSKAIERALVKETRVGALKLMKARLESLQEVTHG